MRRIALAVLVLAAVPRGAPANGRPPATSSISFQQGNDREIAVGLTFGLVLSHDGGKTWAWICEDAIGYSGIYDPHYSLAPTGTLFATSYNGIQVMRDGCTFSPTPAGTAFASAGLLASDQTYYYAISQPADPSSQIAADFGLYKLTGDGTVLAPLAPPTQAVSWWQTLAVAPSDPQRLYLTGYNFVPGAVDNAKAPLLFRSEDGGASWRQIPLDPTQVQMMSKSVIDIVAIDPRNPDHLYARVEVEDNTLSDAVYRSLDKGETWTRIEGKHTTINAFLARANGDLVLGTQAVGAEVSHDDGATWTPLEGAPHITCLSENAAHEVWACTQNYMFSSLPPDGAGVMKSTDLATWTRVLRYEDLTDTVSCAPGTPQHDICDGRWCGVCAQLGCNPSPAYNCPVAMEVPITPAPGKAGCCDTGSGGATALALGLGIGTLLLRPRRRVAS
ncbi:MAG TPA: hypothetical protein VFT22_18600 [Kofleriaceae bacterium]|nr:hypothetical protein [Kofleriaceae bacterium]